MEFVSTKGTAKSVNFEQAVLNGFAEDGGMYVPKDIPTISMAQMESWSDLSFQELAFHILSLYIDEKTIPAADLKQLITKSTETFSHKDVVPVVPLANKDNHYVLELFHGPTLSFKDVAMSFLVNCMDYFLQRKNQKRSLVIATTGDTGPAAAYAAKGKSTIDCWVLYPRGFISEEQERQITTLGADNIHAVAVENCPCGGDDLDDVIAELFADRDLVAQHNLSSVNSINWCRVMYQSIHYFYAYFQVAKKIGEPITYSVPTGAFGNMFAGYLAREMGLPVNLFICANNNNATIHRVHNTGQFGRNPLVQTPSNAIDIATPYNFWRYLYFISGKNGEQIRQWMQRYQEQGYVEFNDDVLANIKRGFQAQQISDELTLQTISEIYQSCENYLLDPHGAVAVAAGEHYLATDESPTKVISLLTAHPAKFPDVIRQIMSNEEELPKEMTHLSIEEVKYQFQKVELITHNKLKQALIHGFESV